MQNLNSSNVFVAGENVKKILVIEENLPTRKLFLECFKAKGFNTIGAENGIVALQRVKKELPDLIVSEIGVPMLDGYGVLAKLRQDPVASVIPFIFVTNRTERADFRKAMELGADDYLTKPCSLKELMAAIAAQMKKRTALHRWYKEETQETDQPSSVKESEQSIFPNSSQMNQVFQFIEQNYQQQITLCDIAQAVGYSPAYLTNLMRQQTGKSVHRWLVERRMAGAIALLLKTDNTVSQIAETVGYQDVCHFSRYFRQFYGTSPQAWRNMQRCSEKAS